ncbi:hypothetical protein AAMO2058_000422500 [Amorphochlora amoebiformis]
MVAPALFLGIWVVVQCLGARNSVNVDTLDLTHDAGMTNAVLVGGTPRPAARRFLRCNGKKTVQGIIGEVLQDHKVVNAARYKTGLLSESYHLFYPCTWSGVEEYMDMAVELYNGTNPNAVMFAVDGSSSLHSKELLWARLEATWGREKASEIMPETFLLNRMSNVELFRLRYEPQKWYIMKRNIERKQGLHIFKTNINGTANDILSQIADLNKENKDWEFVVMQNYIRDPYLINGHKLNLRLYLLATCYPNQKQTVRKFYLYNNGKCLYTSQKYKNSSADENEQITSIHFKPKQYEELELPETVEDLRAYWKSTGIDHERVFRDIHKVVSDATKAVSTHICNDGKFHNHVRFEHYGTDIILTKDLKPYLMEFNYGPSLGTANAKDHKMKKMMVEDMLSGVGVIPDLKRPKGYKGFELVGEKDGEYQIDDSYYELKE